MNARKNILISALTSLAFLLVACGGGGSNPPPPSIGVSFSPQPPASMVISTVSNLTAVVTNDNAAAGVTWTVSCGSTDCGSFNPTSTPGNSATTAYAAPGTVPTGSTVTVTATSVSDHTKTASATITITPTATVSVTIQNPPSSVVVGTPTSLTAVVSEDSAAAGVTWSVTCGSAQCGSFNPATSPGNNATTTYTPPTSIPTGNTVTVKATSVTDTTKSATATITITAAPPAVLADGTYVFQISGGDQSGGPYFVAGAFAIANGVITGGEEDYVNANGGGNLTLVPTGSSVTKESSGNIQIILNTGSNGIGVSGLQTFRGTLVSGTRALISEFDTSAAGSGTLDFQTSQAAPSGGYAFNLGGFDNQDNSLFIGGILTFNSTALVPASSTFDVWDDGNTAQEQTFSEGSITAPDSFGRVQISVTPASNGPQFGLSGYIVGPNKIYLVEDLNDSLQGDLGGTALGQGSMSGQFNAGSVAGASYAFLSVGVDINSTATYAGGFSLNSDGTVGGVIAYNDSQADGALPIVGGNWTISSTGRITLSNVTVTNNNSNSNIEGPFTFQLYVDGNGNALELGLDDTQGTYGLSYVQNGDLTPGNYAIQAQGFANADGLPVWSAAGPVTLDSNFNWSGFTDYNVVTGSPVSNVSLSGSTDTSSGLFQLTGLNATTNPVGPGEFGYYVIDNTKVLAIEVDDNQLGVFTIETINNQQ